ncbi:hypothetical protein BN903_1 [Halorubrum sp. AJ67]|nr:hypothetical protein BN903_1 [Halorubrum sp. AJ67]
MVNHPLNSVQYRGATERSVQILHLPESVTDSSHVRPPNE